MSINIEHYPNKNFSIFPFTPVFSVDLNKSVKEKLNEGEQLTNATALKILKQIKWKSDIFSFLTKPIVAIALSAGVFGVGLAISAAGAAGLAIPVVGIALVAAGLFVSVLGIAMVGHFIENSLNGLLSRLSQAYRDQSQRASEYIGTLETADHEMRFVLPEAHDYQVRVVLA